MNYFVAPTLLLAAATGMLAASEEGTFDKSLSVSGPVQLDVQTDSGSITVKQGSSGTVRIHAVLRSDHGWFTSTGDVSARIQQIINHPPIEQSGNRLRVGHVSDSHLLKDISIRFEIETPADTQLHAHADSGGIHVDGIQGPVDCKTDSGGIDINDVSADVRAVADSGGIHARNIKGSLVAHVDSGGIEASGIAGSIEANADSGSVRLSQTTPAPITAKADSGGVKVTLAHGAGYDIRADVDSGHISIPESTVHSAFSSHHIEGRVAGGGPLVKVQTESGSVVID